MKGACAAEFTKYAMCMEKGGDRMQYHKCRVTQAEFDGCMFDKLNMERPHFGYHALVKVHQTDRYANSS